MKGRGLGLVREVVAIAFWLYLPLKLFVFDIDVHSLQRISPDLVWLLQYKLIATMAVLAVLWLVLGHRSFFASLGYVLAYPVILIVTRLPKQILRSWPLLLLFSPVIYSAVQRARSTFVLYTLAIICILLIALQANKVVSVTAMVGVAIFGAVHLFRSLRKAYSTRVFQQLTKIVRDFREAIQSGRIEATVTESSKAAPQTTPNNPSGRGPLMNLYACHAFADLVAEKVHDLIRRRVFDIYLIASWLYTVGVTFLVYGLEYWALHGLYPASFKGAEGAGFWDFAGFSLSILTTNSLSRIEPATELATIICYSEVACSALILVILVFSILTAAREAFREYAQELSLELRATATAVEKRVAQVYGLTLVQLELAGMRENAILVNLLRRARGN